MVIKTIVAVLICIVVVASTSCSETPQPVQFESPKWKSGNTTVRRAMSWDISERNLLIGLSRDDVLQLLGPPEYQEVAFFAYNTDTRKAAERLFSSAQLHMIVALDESTGLVKSVGFVDR